MKLTVSLLIPLLDAKTPKNCNLSGTGIFDPVGYGLDRFVYNIDYRIKTSGKLYNKGKIKQAAAEIIHQHSDSSDYKYTDAWVACTDIDIETQYLIKCYNDGSFDLNGKKGNAITLPNCYEKVNTTQKPRPTRKPKIEKPIPEGFASSAVQAAIDTFTASALPEVVYTTPTSFRPVKPFKELEGEKPKKVKKEKPVVGCDPVQLGSFGQKEYNLADHGCKKGYADTPSGGRKEKKGNSCVRTCKGSDGVVESRYPIACYCKKDDCYYQIKIKKVGKLRWDAKDPNGQPYVSSHACVQNSAAKLPLPMAIAPEQVEWENDGFCSTLPMADSTFDWSCTNDNMAGSICTKQCGDGFMNNGDRYAHQCVCMESCVWNSHMGLFTRSFSAAECVPAFCKIPHGDAPVALQDTYAWNWPPRPLKCVSSDGTEIDEGSTGTNYPLGAICTKECPDYYRHPLSSMGIDGGTTSTCKCSMDHNKRTSCDFDPVNLHTCLPAVCSTNAQELYAAGLESSALRIWFRAPYRLDCEKLVPEGHMHAGKAEYGSSCDIKCALGWRLEDRNSDTFKLTCGVNRFQFGWTLPGPYPRCVQTCETMNPPMNLKEQNAGVPEDSVIWHCNDSNYVNSVCQKSCGTGFILKGSKTISNCYCKGKDCEGGPTWKGGTSNCVRHVMRAEQERQHDEARDAIDEFIGNIFG